MAQFSILCDAPYLCKKCKKYIREGQFHQCWSGKLVYTPRRQHDITKIRRKKR